MVFDHHQLSISAASEGDADNKAFRGEEARPRVGWVRAERLPGGEKAEAKLSGRGGIW